MCNIAVISVTAVMGEGRETHSFPRKEEDIIISAQHNHVISYDNLSGLHYSMSDAFCRAAC